MILQRHQNVLKRQSKQIMQKKKVLVAMSDALGSWANAWLAQAKMVQQRERETWHLADGNPNVLGEWLSKYSVRGRGGGVLVR